MERRVVTTNRDCAARLVPTGDPLTIPAGSFVTLTQALGGTFTVVHQGNMARISGADADAIGMQVEALEFSASDKQPDPDHIEQALSSVYDPEIPVNIRDLGLIYNVAVSADEVTVDMTLTAPGCGMGPVLVAEVEERLLQVPGINNVSVDLVFDPPWQRHMMSEAAQLELGLF